MTWFWYVLVAELLLGGNGHLLEFFGLAIRTWLLIIFLLLWFTNVLWRHQFYKLQATSYKLSIPLLGIAVSIGMIVGMSSGHDPRAIIRDAIPFAYFLLLFPAQKYLTPDRLPVYKKLVQAFVILTAAMSSITLFLFSSGISVVQGPYYKWFRDVAGGKITDVGDHFFRIVLPEHLLLVPILLFLLSHLMHHKTQGIWVVIAMIPFMVNLSRTYFIAFLIGLFFLFSRERWKTWLTVSAGSILLGLVLFSGIHLAASRGQSLGFELLTGRIASIASPDSERSAATRKTLLAPIWTEIKKHPVLGTGLGATITFIDPVSEETVTTRHFDWGYLELWAELGALGLLSYLSLIAYLLSQTPGAVRASVAALAFMGITTPALFHVFGVAALVALMAIGVSSARPPAPPRTPTPVS